jgi:hypothetical protein
MPTNPVDGLLSITPVQYQATPAPTITPMLVTTANTSAIPTPPPPPPALNSFFDIAPFHDIQFLWLNTIPIWAMIGFVIVVAWLWYNMSWWRKCSVLSPCYGYKDVLMAGSIDAQQNIVFTKSRKWFIRLLTYHSEGMLYFKDLLRTDMWHMGESSAVGTLGGISAAITKDSFDEVIDPIADVALCTLGYDFNHGLFGDDKNRGRAQSEIKVMKFARVDGSECSFYDAIKEGILPVSISSFDDFVRLRPILEAIWPDGIRISGFMIYNPYEADKFTPKQRSASLLGGTIIQDARDFAEDNIPDLSFWEKNGVAMILVLGGLLIMGASFLATR